ncbi:MAG: hypothetical protein JO121_10505, partial [Deltaproteobacteria bacterium]|nr:hypothetical protein [Deltaproteobacteria bacterium]
HEPVPAKPAVENTEPAKPLAAAAAAALGPTPDAPKRVAGSSVLLKPVR